MPSYHLMSLGEDIRYHLCFPIYRAFVRVALFQKHQIPETAGRTGGSRPAIRSFSVPQMAHAPDWAGTLPLLHLNSSPELHPGL